MFKIIIVEDDINIRLELEILLRNACYEVLSIECFEDVAAQIIALDADIVLLDIKLPNQNGLHICSGVRKTSAVPIIFVTCQNTSMDELNCITMGGDDYVAKPYNAPVLLARIAAVLKRSKKEISNLDNVLVYKELTLDILAGNLKFHGNEVDLTKNELKIMYYLFQHKGEIVQRSDIIDFLWDNQIFIDDNTLSVNITRIRTKLDEIGVNHFIETKRGLGYKI